MTDLTTDRLKVNALWAELKRDRWRGPTSTRDLDEHGSKPPYRTLSSGRIPNTPKRDSQHRQTDGSAQVLIGTIHPDERLGTTEPTYVILTREAHDKIMRDAPTICLHDLHHAIINNEPAPYAWWINGRREWHLHRNYSGWLTDPVYGILHKLAEAAITTREVATHTEENPIPYSPTGYVLQ